MKRKKRFSWCILLVLSVIFSPVVSRGEEPILKPGVLIQCGASALRVNYAATPDVVDWNNDGRKDLVVGEFTDGKILLLLNAGTDAAPVFPSKEYLTVNGTAITTSYG